MVLIDCSLLENFLGLRQFSLQGRSGLRFYRGIGKHKIGSANDFAPTRNFWQVFKAEITIEGARAQSSIIDAYRPDIAFFRQFYF